MSKQNKPASGCAIEYMPADATKWLQNRVSHINKQLAKLQEYVTAHNENWQNVLLYLAFGPEYKIEDRRKECLDWLQTNNAPAYVYEDYINKAIANLGEDNVKYWKGLAPLLRVSDDYSSTAAPINLTQDVDISSEFWCISQKWQAKKLQGYKVKVSPQVAQDFEAFKQAAGVFSDLVKRGYDLSQALQAIEYGKSLKEFDLEWFDNSWLDEITKKKFAESHSLQITAALRTPATPCEGESAAGDTWL